MSSITADGSGVPTENQKDVDPSVGFAPLHMNQTYIDYGDKDFKKWLKSQPREKRTRLKELYEGLEKYNRGTHKNKSFTDRRIMRRIDDWNLCHAMSCQLECANWEKKAIWHILDRLDMRAFKKYETGEREGTRKAALVSYCIAILLYNDRQTDKKLRYYPGKTITESPKYDGLFRPCGGLRDMPLILKEVGDDLGFSNETVISCLEKVRTETGKALPEVRAGKLWSDALADSDCWSEYINPRPPI